MKIVYQKRALNRLAHIAAWIGRENPHAARRLVQRIREAISALADFPEQGRVGPRPGTRELVISGTPYVAAYRVRAGRVEILTVRDSRRRPLAPRD